MALDSDSLLLAHVAPWSFRPVGVRVGRSGPRGALLRAQPGGTNQARPRGHR